MCLVAYLLQLTVSFTIFPHALFYMKILITGVAGFIGFHVANRLMLDGHEVVGIDNLSDNGDLKLKHDRMNQLGVDCSRCTDGAELRSEIGKFTLIKADILDKEAMRALCLREKFHTVVHLAASTGIDASNADPEYFFLNNVVGTENMLESSRVSGVQHFFFSSSATVYGSRAKAPFNEEDDVDTPMNMYGGTKRMCELLCHSYANCYKLNVTVFRFFTAYGAWARPSSLPMKVALDIMNGNTVKVVNNGLLVRDFTYVDDITDGIMSALVNPPVLNRADPFALYNIGCAKPVPLLAFIQTIEMSLDIPATVETTSDLSTAASQVTEMYADISKLNNDLAYSPVWDYTEGVPMFTDWLKKYYHV